MGYEDGQYLCIAGHRFYPERVKPIIYKKIMEDEEMGNRYKCDLDRDKIKKLIAENKSVPEIVAITGYKINSVRTVLKTLGLKSSKDGRGRKLGSVNKIKPTGASNNVEKPEIKIQNKKLRVLRFPPGLGSPKTLSDITSVDILIAERNDLQARVFKINQAIELLS
jgi:hypothetical protein